MHGRGPSLVNVVDATQYKFYVVPMELGGNLSLPDGPRRTAALDPLRAFDQVCADRDPDAHALETWANNGPSEKDS